MLGLEEDIFAFGPVDEIKIHYRAFSSMTNERAKGTVVGDPVLARLSRGTAGHQGGFRRAMVL